MFQGIITHLGKVMQVEKKGRFMRLGIISELFTGRAEGSSIAVNGACLTIVRKDGGLAFFDVVGETLGKTNLGSLKKGDKVNLEAPLKLGDEIGGNLIQGHVEGVAEVIERTEEGENCRMVFHLPPHLLQYIIPKGFIAVDGISLTVVNVSPQERTFSIALIPETRKRTTLGFKKKGDTVNIETDVLVRSMLQRSMEGLNSELLALHAATDELKIEVEKLKKKR